jgi:hypothetical protein
MSQWRSTWGFRIVVAVVGFLVLLATVPTASAQTQSGTAEVKRVVGRVEVLKKGQVQWLPVVVGARLTEGDDIRAYAAATAELGLPDGSSIIVAENSRVVITRLEYDAANQTRLVLFHLAVGKVIASVTRTALSLVRARQSNFSITTPTAVAAARGTLFEVTHDPSDQVTRMAVLEEDGPPRPATR